MCLSLMECHFETCLYLHYYCNYLHHGMFQHCCTLSAGLQYDTQIHTLAKATFMLTCIQGHVTLKYKFGTLEAASKPK